MDIIIQRNLGKAALVTVRVDDGQDNPIGNVQVGIESPASVLLAPSQGFTNTF